MTGPRQRIRASRQQEKEAAEDIGGRVQPGSGCSDRAKGDIRRAGDLRGEMKTTTGKGIRVTEEMLDKIGREAGGFELPFLQLQFERMSGNKKYAVIRWHDFLMLLEESGLVERDP